MPTLCRYSSCSDAAAAAVAANLQLFEHHAVVGKGTKCVAYRKHAIQSTYEHLGYQARASAVFSTLQQTGHKLRVFVPDTAVISGGVLKAWLYSSSKTGVLQSVPRCQHSIAALLQKLKAPHLAYDSANPDGWVAVAHFSDGLSWLVDAAGLEQLVSAAVGNCTSTTASAAAAATAATAQLYYYSTVCWAACVRSQPRPGS
jgi:hypothetical protein